MAGVKGRSGGARPGAGRKAKPKADRPQINGAVVGEEKLDAMPEVVPAVEDQKPLEFLLALQNNSSVDIKTRLRAAIAAAQYVHLKRGDGGKKEDDLGKAKKAGTGKFSAATPPRLAAVNGKKP